MPGTDRLIRRNADLLRHGAELLEEIGPARFRKPLSGERGTIGRQLRHVLDFYDCFLKGCPRGEVDYDRRGRRGDLERDPAVAAVVLRDLAARIASIPSEAVDAPLRVLSEAEVDDTRSQSTVRRELQFLLSHTVHHYALIALMLRLDGFDAPESFGVAPSTLAHEATS